MHNLDPAGIKVANGTLDLARAKAVEILDLVKELERSCDDDELKAKYWMCADNYNKAIRDIDQEKIYMSAPWEYPDHPVDVDYPFDDFKECRLSFQNTEFGRKNDEFVTYVHLYVDAIFQAVVE